MSFLRRAHCLSRLLLLWCVLSLGAAVASPLVHPQALELVCSSAGEVKVIVLADGGGEDLGRGHMDCPLCMPSGDAPPAAIVALPATLALSCAVQSIAAARIAAATAVPFPARGPPRFA